jgi:oxaloacetate decarboxylase alpha subunit
MDNDLQIVDTTMRDGQLSLWATQMSTAMIEPVAHHFEEAGLHAAELLSSAFFKKVVRDLHDDPFERIRRVKAAMPTTPLRVIHTRQALAFQITPPELYERWTSRLAANGIDEIRLSDPSNTPESWARNIASASASGLRVTVSLVFSVSPKHTDDYYAVRAKAAAQLPVAGIALKDPSGLLTPERVHTLVPRIQQEIGDVPLEFHGHCNNGQGLRNALEAIRLGVRIVNTAIPPLADGASLPDVFAVLDNAAALGISSPVATEPLRMISDHLTQVRRAHDFPEGRIAPFDESYYSHQVPGGMISNLRRQLEQAGMQDRLDEVLEEIGRVREDLGYPIMVTPYSQFVGIQAVMNVMTGRRYGEVIDEVLQYALGVWGAEEADGVDPDVKDKLLDRRRAQELQSEAGREVTIKDLRRAVDGEVLDEDELLLRIFAGDDAVDRMKASPAPGTWTAAMPWMSLVERLAASGGFRQVLVQKDGASLYMERQR